MNKNSTTAERLLLAGTCTQSPASLAQGSRGQAETLVKPSSKATCLLCRDAACWTGLQSNKPCSGVVRAGHITSTNAQHSPCLQPSATPGSGTRLPAPWSFSTAWCLTNKKRACTHRAAAANAAKMPNKTVGVTLNHSGSHIRSTHTAVAVHCSKRKVGTQTAMHLVTPTAHENAMAATHTCKPTRNVGIRTILKNKQKPLMHSSNKPIQSRHTFVSQSQTKPHPRQLPTLTGGRHTCAHTLCTPLMM